MTPLCLFVCSHAYTHTLSLYHVCADSPTRSHNLSSVYVTTRTNTCCQILLDENPNVNLLDSKQLTPLMWACHLGDSTTTGLLVRHPLGTTVQQCSLTASAAGAAEQAWADRPAHCGGTQGPGLCPRAGALRGSDRCAMCCVRCVTDIDPLPAAPLPPSPQHTERPIIDSVLSSGLQI